MRKKREESHEPWPSSKSIKGHGWAGTRIPFPPLRIPLSAPAVAALDRLIKDSSCSCSPAEPRGTTAPVGRPSWTSALAGER